MIAFFLPWALKLLGPKFKHWAAPLAWAFAAVSALLAVLALWGLITWAIHHHDKGVVNAYENQQQAIAVNEAAAGSNVANAQDTIIAAHDAERANAVQEDINAAVVAHPKEARASVGPASRAALERLRRQ